MKQSTLLDLECPEGYTAGQLDAISAEDDFSRGRAGERLVKVLARYLDHRMASIRIPDGITKVHYIGSKFAGEPPDSVEWLIDRLQRWTLSSGYAHYSRCADGLTMFSGNFEEYTAAFHIDVWTGSEADRVFTELMRSNPGWQSAGPALRKGIL